MNKNWLICLVMFLLWSCGEDDRVQQEIARIPVEVDLERFDRRFADATADSLDVLKRDFPYLFPEEYPDSVWIDQMQDTIQLELNRAVAGEYPNLDNLRKELGMFFQHVKYYFPEQEVPDVVTLTSYVDYRNQVIWTDSLLLISLDTYLGKDHRLYQGIQDYLKKNLNRDQILPDVAKAFGETRISRPESRNFLAHMIYYGKILYLQDKLLPFVQEAEKIGYTMEELQWAKSNEDQIWRYFVERELLYSSDTDLYNRFLYPAPFSKFYLQLDNEAPPRLGQYIGWQIVQDFVTETGASLQEVIAADANSIFQKSNYKPER